jgi:malate dehydrogenase (oxaloacetate-decarboxylating)(NADP+)
VNLEDIKAPECFIIEERLKKEMQIPVFHDDQHGTAIISGAALLNALELQGKKIDQVRVVVSGAGASAIACTTFWIKLGVKIENVLLVDTKGVIFKGRTDGMNKWKEPFARETRCRTLADAMEGADVFLGGSVKGLVTPEMLKKMAKKPVIFALANPDPEIGYWEAKEARPDAVVATGRSDYPNQVNNVLGFPGIFRGALDVRARQINEEMKLAAAKSLAALAREDVPESVSRAYGGESFSFGPDYIIPKPVDPRVLTWVAPAVAKTAMETGVARIKVDLDEYKERLQKRLSRRHQVMSTVMTKAKKKLTRIAFNDGEHVRILQAARILKEEGLCEPILLGNVEQVTRNMKELGLADDLAGVKIVDPQKSPEAARYAEEYWKLRNRRGITKDVARVRSSQRSYYSSLMVKLGDADGLITGLTQNYADAVRPSLEIIRPSAGRHVGGVYVVITRNDFAFFADCTVNPNPTPENLAEIAAATADLARYFDVKPRVAMLSYSSFGEAKGDSPEKMRRATELVRQARPDLEIDGEMQVDSALVAEERESRYPFSKLTGDANVLVFPNLDAANIAYKLVWRMGGAEVVGPMLLGMSQAVNVLQQNASVQDIVNLASVTALRAQGDEFRF